MRGLTKKQRGFVRDLIKTGHITKSAQKNYDAKNVNVAANIGSTNLIKPKIQEALRPVLERYQNELEAILDAMELKNKNSEEYKTLVDAADKVQKQIQILSGGVTERNVLKIEISKEIADKNNVPT